MGYLMALFVAQEILPVRLFGAAADRNSREASISKAQFSL
jgi:hypothetical protein